jgi:hypothetical protein
MKIRKINILALLFLLYAITSQAQTGAKWSTDKAWEWYNSTSWVCGFNYIPSNAINYTAMWDKTSFSPDLIDRELALAASTGFNAVRVVLQYIVWAEDPKYFKDTFTRFLSICSKYKIKVMPCFFDDCVFGTNRDPNLGIQPEPFKGWYAWAWSPSPGHTIASDSTNLPKLEKYVKDIISTYKDNPAILLWDLYNEPTNSGMGNKSFPLVKGVFRWAREVNPSQPVSIGTWNNNKELNDIIYANSDVITFHSYNPRPAVEKTIQELKLQKRPMICTEWLNRPRGSSVEGILPLFAAEKVGAMHWGLVNGKTQTDLPWGHRPGDGPYYRVWQHDLYTTDFKVYSPYEIQLFKSYIDQSKAK